MGHISDRTLDTLLDGSIDDAGELAIEEHVRHCARCARRLREWELLFPQIKSLIPSGEHPGMAGSAAAVPRMPAVFVPDWSPARSTITPMPTRIAWGLVVVLALGAGYLLLLGPSEESPAAGYLPAGFASPGETAAIDSAGLGSGISESAGTRLAAIDTTSTRDSVAAPTRDSVPLAPSQQPVVTAEAPKPEPPAREEPPPREVASRDTQEEDSRPAVRDRESAVTFPIKRQPATRQPVAPSTPVTQENPPEEAGTPLPAQFQRVSLGEAIARLAGTVRLIEGLNPEAVEIAQGTVLPGADPAKAVVRVVYNAPEGRLILDQQRLGRGGSPEPNIAISTAPNGVSVAQWVDRGGFWISLAGRASQQTLLAIANRIR